MKKEILSIFCFLLLISLIWSQPPPLLSKGMIQPYGVNIPSGQGFWVNVDAQQYPQLANLLKRAGVQWVRLGVRWDLLEPQPGVWDEEFAAQFGALLAALRSKGIKVSLVLNKPPDWAGLPPRRGPWVRFVQEMVSRYNVEAWEILNEPSHWEEYTENKEAYVRLVKDAAAIIRNKDTQDLVVLGGLGPPPAKQTWRSEAIKYWLKYAGPSVDVLNVHKYGDDALVAEKIQTFKQWAIEAGVGAKPIWLTETNIKSPTEKCDRDDFECMNPPDGPKKLQSRYRMALDLEMEKVFWWQFISSPWGPGLLIPPEGDVGYKPNGRMYSAYQSMVFNKVFCKEPRPQICTMECIINPPYICGSDGKSYCSTCQACSNPKVEWYVIQDKPCEAE